MEHTKVILHSPWDMSTQQSAILTSAGGMLSFINGLLSTGQLLDAAMLGAAGALGAFAFSLLVKLLTKLKPLFLRLWQYTIRKHTWKASTSVFNTKTKQDSASNQSKQL